MATETNAGELVLRKFVDRLAGILDPIPVATKLYAREVISQEAWELARGEGANYDRNLKLLEAVLRSVRADGGCFDKLCDILKEEQVTAGIARQLHAERKKTLVEPQREDQYSGSDDKSRGNKHEENVQKPVKRRSSGGEQQEKKRSIVLKEGPITGGDSFLMDIARDIGGKWEEVGVALGIGFKDLESAMASKMTKSDHMKAFYMLQEWRDQAAEKFTYAHLASALERVRLNTSARDHCYTSL